MEMDRTANMLQLYGECCTQERAAKILGKCARTVRRMLDDGRLLRSCSGTMVDVRSIASYIVNPGEENFSARARKRKAK